MQSLTASKKAHIFIAVAWLLVFSILVTGCNAPGEPTTPFSPTDTPTGDTVQPSNSPTEVATTTPTLPKEEIFTKSIHDFGDLRVDNLDDQENTNFVVYASGVKEITATETTNVLIDSDPEVLSYTFANADDMLKSMEPGDVFFAPVSKEYPDGLSIKVKQINITNDRVVILSDEVGLADLFEYADIFMDISMEQPTYDSSSLEEDSEIVIGSGESMHAYSEARIHTLSSTTLQPEIQLRQELSVESGIAKLTGALSASITKITVEFRFSRENLQLFFGVWTDTCYEYSVTAQLSKSIEGSRKFPQISVPVYGILKLHINPTFYWNGHGNAVGTIRYTEALQNGIIANISTKDINFDASSQWLQYGQTTGQLDEMDGHFTLGLNLDSSLGVAGIGKVGAVFDGSATVSAALDKSTETTPDEDTESIHTCDLCYSGNVSTAVSFDLGVGINLIDNAKSNNDREADGYTFQKRVYEHNWELGYFYISIMDGTSSFDWGICPNVFSRTIIRVFTKGGDWAEGVLVTAVNPLIDMEKIISSAVSNANGEAVMYLPDNTYLYLFADGDRQGGRTEYQWSYDDHTIYMRANNLNIEFYNSGIPFSPTGGTATAYYGKVYTYISKHYPNAEYTNVYISTNYALPTSIREHVPGDYFLSIDIHPASGTYPGSRTFSLYKVESNGDEWGTRIMTWSDSPNDDPSGLLNNEIFPYIDALLEAEYGTTSP
ncbi:MAG: hypothetical protein IKK90_06330 [Bacteroides sp.]|nr:hypothetical protein [Bacteroides sp.]